MSIFVVFLALSKNCWVQRLEKEVKNMKFELTASMMCANYGNLEKEVKALW